MISTVASYLISILLAFHNCLVRQLAYFSISVIAAILPLKTLLNSLAYQLIVCTQSLIIEYGLTYSTNEQKHLD